MAKHARAPNASERWFPYTHRKSSVFLQALRNTARTSKHGHLLHGEPNISSFLLN